MPTFPLDAGWPPGEPVVISTLSRWLSLGGLFPTTGGNLAWGANNRANFLPFRVPRPLIARALFVGNGTNLSGNVDLGIYARGSAGDTLVRLVSTGSTARAGSGEQQDIDIPDTLLGPGRYYFGLALSNLSGTVLGTVTNAAPATALLGGFSAEDAFPLPATVPAGSSTHFWVIGVRGTGKV
jgi:hypothetical protein